VIQLADLEHREVDLRGFYSRFSGEVVVGIETSGYSTGSSNSYMASARGAYLGCRRGHATRQAEVSERPARHLKEEGQGD
jgi:hypothetical protein